MNTELRRFWGELRRSRRPGTWFCLTGLSAMKCGGVLAVALAGWTAAASYLFVQFGGLGGKLARPWLAWWLYASNSPDGWTVTLLAASAALPLVLVAAATFAIWRLRSAYDRTFPRPLYGDSTWATDSEKQSAGIKQSRSPF